VCGAWGTVLATAGFAPVAGSGGAGRGACAGPLVVAAVVLDPAHIKRVRGLADSKLLTAAAREDVYAEVLRWALDWHVVVIGNDQIDALGLHVCNVAGMRRACAGLRCRPGYVLTDMTAQHFADPAVRQRALGRHPLGRMGTADDIAKVVLFLCSPQSQWITGQTVNASGGFVV